MKQEYDDFVEKVQKEYTEEVFTFAIHKNGNAMAFNSSLDIEFNPNTGYWRFDSNKSGIVGTGKTLKAASISHYRALEV